MLFDAAVRRELSRSFAATTVVVLTIVITMMLIRMLGLAAKGRAAPTDVMLLLGYTAMGHLATVLCLSLFVAVVITFGRMHRDSEMAVWQSSGMSLMSFLAPLARMALPVLAVAALLLCFAWPWVNRQNLELRQRYEQRSDLTRVAPGTFQSSADGQRVFYIDRDQPQSREARNVFVLSRQGEVESVTTARGGRIEATAGREQALILEQGQRTDVHLGTGETSVAGFERYRLVVKQATERAATALPPKATDTWTLLAQRSPPGDGELAWRAGLWMAGVNLMPLGIGLAASQTRRPTNWNLLLALLTFIVYFNLVNLSQAWVASGKWALGPGLVLLHGGVLMCAAALLWWRVHGMALAFSWRRRR